MAKKKSKRFIIPSVHFLTHAGEKPTPDPVPVKLAPEPESEPAAVTHEALATVQHQVENAQVGEQKEAVKPKPLDLGKTARRTSALSLSSLKIRKEEEASRQNQEEELSDASHLPRDPFTEERFLEIWEDYILDLHDKGEKLLASVLKADTPQIRKERICMTYPNELMKTELLKVRPRVLRYLRSQLNNHGIDFEITVNEDSTKRFAYTPQEKYELLKEKNKALSSLRRAFNLEL